MLNVVLFDAVTVVLQVIEVLLEKCREQELSLEEANSLSEKCREVEDELMQLRTDLDVARYNVCFFCVCDFVAVNKKYF